VTIPFPPNPVMFTEEEKERIEQVAERFGMTLEETADALATGGIADRVKKRTGYRPAKVYSIKKNK